MSNLSTKNLLAALGLALLAVVFWSWQDILLWQRIFETNELWQFDSLYHRGWPVALYGFILFGALVFIVTHKYLTAATFAVLTWLLANSGLADILYYLLDGRSIPASLPWLDEPGHPLFLFHPVTSLNIWWSPLLWIAFLVAIWGMLDLLNFLSDLD